MKYVTKSREVEAYEMSPANGPGMDCWPDWFREAKDRLTIDWGEWVVLDQGNVKVYTDEEFKSNFSGYDPQPCVDGQEHNWSERWGSCKNCGFSREMQQPAYEHQKEFGVSAWHADLHSSNPKFGTGPSIDHATKPRKTADSIPQDLVIRYVDGKEEVHVLRKPLNIPPVPDLSDCPCGTQSTWLARVYDWLVACREEMKR